MRSLSQHALDLRDTTRQAAKARAWTLSPEGYRVLADPAALGPTAGSLLGAPGPHLAVRACSAGPSLEP